MGYKKLVQEVQKVVGEDYNVRIEYGFLKIEAVAKGMSGKTTESLMEVLDSIEKIINADNQYTMGASTFIPDGVSIALTEKSHAFRHKTYIREGQKVSEAIKDLSAKHGGIETVLIHTPEFIKENLELLEKYIGAELGGDMYLLSKEHYQDLIAYKSMCLKDDLVTDVLVPQLDYVPIKLKNTYISNEVVVKFKDGLVAYLDYDYDGAYFLCIETRRK